MAIPPESRLGRPDRQDSRRRRYGGPLDLQTDPLAPHGALRGRYLGAPYRPMAATKSKSRSKSPRTQKSATGARKSPTTKRGRGKLAPRGSARGLDAADVAIAMDSAEIADVVALVRSAGGALIGAYRDPLGGRPVVLASLPLNAVQPTPFQ